MIIGIAVIVAALIVSREAHKRCCKRKYSFANRVAQSVAQPTCNANVPGSPPVAGECEI